MDTAPQVVQALGLLVILAGASLVFIRIVRLIIGKRRHSGRIGFEFLLFFTVLYIFAGPALALIGLATATADVQKGTAFLWWVTLAFTVNASLKRFVWDGILSVDGTRKVPKILTLIDVAKERSTEDAQFLEMMTSEEGHGISNVRSAYLAEESKLDPDARMKLLAAANYCERLIWLFGNMGRHYMALKV